MGLKGDSYDVVILRLIAFWNKKEVQRDLGIPTELLDIEKEEG